MSDPNINHLNRVSEAMIIPNIIQFLQIEGDTVAGATLRGGINFKHADGASGDSITFVATDESGNDRTNLQLQFNANLEDLEDVTRTGAAAGHMMVYNDATDKYHSQPITGHATVGTGGVVTLSVDVVGITNLNVATHGSSGHILFNNNDGLDFIEPVLNHLGDVSQDGNVISGHILVNNGTVYQNKAVSGDATISGLGVLTISDDKIGTDELKGLTTGNVDWVIGPDGSGSLKFQNRVINIEDITPPPIGHTGMMFHDGSTAFFMEGLNIPSLSYNQHGACGGIIQGSEMVGSPGIGSSNLLGITGDGSGNKTWAWLNVTEIGTGATGIAGLEEMSLNLPILDGHVFVGHTIDGHFTNRVISGDVTINSDGVVAIGAAKVTNAMMANAGGITLATPVGSGLTYSAGGGTNMAGAGITLGGDNSLEVVIDGSTINIDSGAIRVKPLGIDTAQLKDDAVTANKIVANAVTTVKIPDNAVTNTKLANSTITIDADSGSDDAVPLGGTLRLQGTGPINTINQSGDHMVIACDTATTTIQGVANFSSGDFAVSVGEVTLKASGVDTNKIADDAVNADKIADGAVGLSAMNIKSGEHGASGHVMIRFGDGTNQEVGFVPQSSVTASLVLNDITDVYTGATGAHHVLKVKDGGGGFTTAQLDHSHMANITNNRILGLGAGSPSAPAELTANQVIDIINADGSTVLDAGLLPSGIAYTTSTGNQTFSGKITTTGAGGFGLSALRTGVGMVLSPTYATTSWARSFCIQGTNENDTSYGDMHLQNSVALATFGMYGNGTDESGTGHRIYITARAGDTPWNPADITVMKTNGFVGINDINPTYRLDVNGSIRSTDSLFVNSQMIGSTDTPGAPLHIKPSGTHPHIQLDWTNSPAEYGYIEFGQPNNRSLILGKKERIDIRTDGTFTIKNEYGNSIKFQVESDGKVSIGTAHGDNPAGCLLHLWSEETEDGAYSWTDGSGNFDAELGDDQLGLIHLDVYGLTSSPGRGGAITFGAQDDASSKAQAGIYVATDSGYGTKMAFATTTQYSAGPQTRMVIDDVGHVGINKLNPSYTLDVDGLSRFSGIMYIDVGTTGGIRPDDSSGEGRYTFASDGCIISSATSSESLSAAAYLHIRGNSTDDTRVQIDGPVNTYLDMTDNRIQRVATPIDDADAANKSYVDNTSGIGQGVFFDVNNMGDSSQGGNTREFNVPLTDIRVAGANSVQIDYHDIKVDGTDNIYNYLGYSDANQDNAANIYSEQILGTRHDEETPLHKHHGHHDWDQLPPEFIGFPIPNTFSVGYPSADKIRITDASYNVGSAYSLSGWFRIHNLQRKGSSTNKKVWFECMNYFYTTDSNNQGNPSNRIQIRGTGRYHRDADCTNYQIYLNNSATKFISGSIQGRVLY